MATIDLPEALGEPMDGGGGMADAAQRAMPGRESLNTALTGTGNPALRTVEAVLQAADVRLTFAPVAGRQAHGASVTA